ncbi:MAG: saccharopine dehydrogenase, partial [Nitrospirota bacterium]
TSVPWGDIFTSQISTGIPNAIVYAALPLLACWMFKLINPIRGFLARPGMQKRLISLAGKFLSGGPDAATRAKHRTRFWGRVTTNDGRECSGTIVGPSTYVLTADTTIGISLQSESWEGDGGYFTASMLVGANFLNARKGYKVELTNSD